MQEVFSIPGTLNDLMHCQVIAFRRRRSKVRILPTPPVFSRHYDACGAALNGASKQIASRAVRIGVTLGVSIRRCDFRHRADHAVTSAKAPALILCRMFFLRALKKIPITRELWPIASNSIAPVTSGPARARPEEEDRMTTPDRDDKGATGPAALARPRRTMEWQRRITATRTVTERRDVMADVLLIDRMHGAGGINSRQYHAACRLYGLFIAAGLLPRSTARFDIAPDSALEDAGDFGDILPEEDARVVYRRWIRDLGPYCGLVVDAMMYEQHPKGSIRSARDGLDRLADWWGMEKILDTARS